MGRPSFTQQNKWNWGCNDNVSNKVNYASKCSHCQRRPKSCKAFTKPQNQLLAPTHEAWVVSRTMERLQESQGNNIWSISWPASRDHCKTTTEGGDLMGGCDEDETGGWRWRKISDCSAGDKAEMKGQWQGPRKSHQLRKRSATPRGALRAL